LRCRVLKEIGISVVLILIFIALSLYVDILHLSVQCSNGSSSTNTISISKRGEVYIPDNTSTIAEALNIVAPGGAIYIKSGVYSEDVRVQMPVKIIGLGEVIIDGSIVVASTHSIVIANITIAVYPPGAPSVVIYNSTDVKLSNLSLLYSGIVISSSRNVSIAHSFFSYINSPAVIVELDSSGITVEYCTFNSTYTALTVFSGNNIIFRYNNVYSPRSSYAVKLLSGSSNVYVYMNNFFNSSRGYDEGLNNTWHNPLIGLGNYWEYIAENCNCNQGDRVCETSLEIDGTAGSRDIHPLCKSFEDYIAKTTTTSASSVSKTPKIFIYVAIATVVVVLVVILIRVGRVWWRGSSR